jgi:uncharacterized membrane protein YkoI
VNRLFNFVLSATVLAGMSLSAAKSLKVKDLPPAVQKTVTEQSKGAEIKNIAKETEKGVTQYEVETLLNGKHRDFNVDASGTLLVVEEEASIDSFPAAARAAILKAMAGAKGGKFELVTKSGKTLYEAEFKNKAGKNQAVLVTAGGTEVKD